MIMSLRVAGFLNRAAVNVEGALGGILSFWDSRVLRLVGLKES